MPDDNTFEGYDRIYFGIPARYCPSRSMAGSKIVRSAA